MQYPFKSVKLSDMKPIKHDFNIDDKNVYIVDCYCLRDICTNLSLFQITKKKSKEYYIQLLRNDKKLVRYVFLKN